MTVLSGEPDPSERLAQFIQSPPPIQEMVVECNWFAHTSGTTNTNWVVLCWQTNAYIIRTAKERVGLLEAFNTNKDEVIGIRLGDTYSTVSDYKVLGVHVRRVEGLAKPAERDLVTPMVLAQQNRAWMVLSIGVPLGPPGSAQRNGDTFSYHDGLHDRTLSAVMRVGTQGTVQGFDWRSEPATAGNNLSETVHGPIRYSYADAALPAWFPHEIRRGLVRGDSTNALCRFLVHSLRLGVTQESEFNAERFLPGPAAGGVVTSNGVSYVTLRGITKPVMDPKDPRARGERIDVRSHRALYSALALAFAAGTAALGLVRQRRAPSK